MLKRLHAAFHTNPTLSANSPISKLGAGRYLNRSQGVSWDVYCDVGRPRVERGVIIESNICWAYTGPKGTVAQLQTAHPLSGYSVTGVQQYFDSATTSGISVETVELHCQNASSKLAATSGDFHRCLTAHRLGKYSSKKLTLTLP